MGWDGAGRPIARARAILAACPGSLAEDSSAKQKPRAKYLGVIVMVMVVMIAVIAVIAVIVLAGDHCRSAERKKEEGTPACPGGKPHNPFHDEAQCFADVFRGLKKILGCFGKSQF